MDLTSIFVTGIVFGAIYKVIELIVRRKERLKLIDKITELPPELLADKLPGIKGLQSLLNDNCQDEGNGSRFIGLRWGCLGIGLGFGLLIAGIVIACCPEVDWHVRNWIMGGAVIMSAGIGMLIAFVAEYRLRRKND